MADVATLIADLIGAGVNAELVGRVAAALAEREAVLVPDEAANRRRAADRDRKRLRKSAEVGGFRGMAPSPKEAPQTPEENPPSSPSTHKETPLRGSKKGSRLPSDFVPDLDVAVGLGLSRTEAEHQAAVFIDFWNAKAGADAVKLDWPATWRNWARRAGRETPRQRAGPAGQQVPSMSEMLRVIGDRASENQPGPPEDRSGFRAAIPHLRTVGAG